MRPRQRVAALAPAVLLALLATPAAVAAPRSGATRPPLSETQVAGLGERLEAAVEARLDLVPAADEALAALAARCAARVAPVRPRAFRDPHPRVLGLPGGRVLVSTGLIALATCDDDLVSVLAHEAAHVRAGDLVKRLESAYGPELLARIAVGERDDVLGGIVANVAAGGVLARHSVPADQRAEDAARAAGCGTGAVARLIARGHVTGRPPKTSREHPAAPLPGDAPANPAVDGLERVRAAIRPAP